MRPETALTRLEALQQELGSLPTARDTAAFTSWHARAEGLLIAALGASSPVTLRFAHVGWPAPTWSMENARPKVLTALPGMDGLLSAATALLRDRIEDNAAPDESGVDAELWAHIAPEVSAEAWGKVTSQAVIFTEDRLRKWAGRPVGEVGKDLAIAIFGKSGQFQMGKTDGERQGWQLFAQGVAQALRNVDAHRIQDRPDHKRYAIGLVGACSLLLTQMRYEHGNRFQDTSPAAAMPGP